MQETLIVIDVQNRFISRTIKNPFKQHLPKVLDCIEQQVRLAMERNDHIVFVEMNPEPGDYTLPELLKLTRDYSQKTILSKKDMDGSEEIVDYLRQKDIPRSVLRVCGVWTNQCVLYTVKGLLKRLPRTHIKLVRSACADACSDSEVNRDSVQLVIDLNPERVSGIGPHIW